MTILSEIIKIEGLNINEKAFIEYRKKLDKNFGLDLCDIVELLTLLKKINDDIFIIKANLKKYSTVEIHVTNNIDTNLTKQILVRKTLSLFEKSEYYDYYKQLFSHTDNYNFSIEKALIMYKEGCFESIKSHYDRIIKVLVL